MAEKYQLTKEQQDFIDGAIKRGADASLITDEIKEIIAKTGSFPMFIRTAYDGDYAVAMTPERISAIEKDIADGKLVFD